MLDSKRIKEIMFALGADLCGIASIDRFWCGIIKVDSLFSRIS